MEFQFDKKFQKEFRKVKKDKVTFGNIIESISKAKKHHGNDVQSSTQYLFAFPILFIIFFVIISTLVSLQIFSFDEYSKRSKGNQFEIIEVKPNRGLIVDRNGKRLAENIPAVSVYIDTDMFVKTDLTIDDAKLEETTKKIEEVLGSDSRFSSPKLIDRVKKIWDGYSEADRGWVQKVEVLSGMGNDVAVNIKSAQAYLVGVSAQNGNKRKYPFGNGFAHLLGYTGDVYQEDLETLDYISFNDVIGKSGLELEYDKQLFGQKGKIAQERDSLGQLIEDGKSEITQSVSGATIHLTIDAVAQKAMYKALERGVKKYGADGGAAILQDVNNGEILVMTSYPSFDNDLFVGGISQKDYNKVLKSGKNPLLNRAIAAQVPPGSTFKTIVASAALDAGAITPSTIYVSRRGYTFSDRRPFPEFGNNAYGSLNIISALTVSSNIFFCETIRNWDMDKLVPYLEKFGIGQATGIDLTGEGSGRLPSPENKIKLAKTTSPWLDDVWYPEGDSCNSVIGQGITTVTPLQMVNWISAIANGGTLNTPHLTNILEYPDGKIKGLTWEPKYRNIAKESALALVREGMWSSVNGARRVIVPLSNSKPVVAAKTGTAEFGRVDKDGKYEHTHAWVTGFYPFEAPKYSFVVFLEDGGASNNSAAIAREFINWWNENRK